MAWSFSHSYLIRMRLSLSSRRSFSRCLALAIFTFFGDFRGILNRAEIELAEEKKDSGSEVVEGAEAARIGLDGLDA